MTSSMAGSWMDRSATSYAAATAATTGAALASAGKEQPLARALDPPGRRRRGPRSAAPRRPGRRPGCGSTALPVQVGQVAVEDGGAVVDHDHPAAQRLDVLQVVGGQQQRGAALGVEGAQELPQPALAHHVEPDRRLVEVEDLGVVQQRRRDVAAHPLAEAELAHRGVEQVAEVEQLDELGEVACGSGRRGSGRSSAAARRSRAAGGPTTAWCAGRRPRRSAGPARCGAGSARARPPAGGPPVGTRMPVSILIVVDFPAPFGPM